MACYRPFFLKERGCSVPCGWCIGCRKEYARQWAVRGMHEAKMHEDNCFVTLTYEDMPAYGSLVPRDLQLFFKRLRKAVAPKRFSYFAAGEYGERNRRPHYHACLFGLDFADKVLWAVRGDHRTYRSPLLERCWSDGMSEVGSLTYASVRYVAGYITKKISGKVDPDAYIDVDEETGEITSRVPEFSRVSNRPAIGLRWYEKYGKEVRVTDSVVVAGREEKPPRYYDKLFKLFDPVGMAETSDKRERERNVADAVPSRLLVREKVLAADLKRKERVL